MFETPNILVTEEQINNGEKANDLLLTVLNQPDLFPDHYLFTDQSERLNYLGDLDGKSPYSDMASIYERAHNSIFGSGHYVRSSSRKYWDPSVCYSLYLKHVGYACNPGFPVQSIEHVSIGQFHPFLKDIGFFVDIEKFNKLDIKDIPDIAASINLAGKIITNRINNPDVKDSEIRFTLSSEYLKNQDILSSRARELGIPRYKEYAKHRLILKFIHLAKQLILSLGNKKTEVFSEDKVDRLAFQSMMNLFFADSSCKIFLEFISFCTFNDAWSLLNTKYVDQSLWPSSYIEWTPAKTSRHMKLSYHVKISNNPKPAGMSMYLSYNKPQ